MQNYGIIPAYGMPSKKDLLFFDQFISIDGGISRPSYRSRIGKGFGGPLIDDSQKRADYSYLHDAGIIEEVELNVEQSLQEAKSGGLPVDDVYKELERLEYQLKTGGHYGDLPPLELGGTQHTVEQTLTNIFEYKNHVKVRIFSILSSNESRLYTPIFGVEDISHLTGKQKNIVVQVVINKFPTPSEEICYQDIYEFKSDKKVKNKINLLKRWIRHQVSEENLSAAEIEEELIDNLHDYREYMNLANIKYREEKIYTLLTFPLATIERICKLQFSKLFDPVFNIRKAEITLLEAEIKAPGRELAFLHDSIHKFEKQANK